MSVPLTQSRPRLQRVSCRAVMRLAAPRSGMPLVALRCAVLRCAVSRCAAPQYVAAPRTTCQLHPRAKRAPCPSVLCPPAPAATRAASGDCDCCCAAEPMNHTVNRRIKWNQ